MIQLSQKPSLLNQINSTTPSLTTYETLRQADLNAVINNILKSVISNALVEENRDNLISDQELIFDFFNRLNTELDNNLNLIEKAFEALLDFDSRKFNKLNTKPTTNLNKGITNLRKAVCEILRKQERKKNGADLDDLLLNRRTFNSIAVTFLSTVSSISSATTLVPTPKLLHEEIIFFEDLTKKAVDDMAAVALGEQGLSPKRQNVFNILTLNMRASFEAKIKSNVENNPVRAKNFQNIASLPGAEMHTLAFPTNPNPLYTFFLDNFNTDKNWRIEQGLTKVAKLMEMLTDSQIAKIFEHNEAETNQKILELENMLNYMGSVAYHTLANNHELSAKDIFSAPYKKIVDELESEKLMLEVQRLFSEQSESHFSILA